VPLVGIPTAPGTTLTTPAEAPVPSPQSIVAENVSSVPATALEKPASVNVPTSNVTSKPRYRTGAADTVSAGGTFSMTAANSKDT